MTLWQEKLQLICVFLYHNQCTSLIFRRRAKIPFHVMPTAKQVNVNFLGTGEFIELALTQQNELNFLSGNLDASCLFYL